VELTKVTCPQRPMFRILVMPAHTRAAKETLFAAAALAWHAWPCGNPNRDRSDFPSAFLHTRVGAPTVPPLAGDGGGVVPTAPRRIRFCRPARRFSLGTIEARKPASVSRTAQDL